MRKNLGSPTPRSMSSSSRLSVLPLSAPARPIAAPLKSDRVACSAGVDAEKVDLFFAPQENGGSRHLTQLWWGKGGVIDTYRRGFLPEIVYLRPWRQAAAWMDGILCAVEGFWSSREETKQGCQVKFAGQYLVRQRSHADAARREVGGNDVCSMFLPRSIPIGASVGCRLL